MASSPVGARRIEKPSFAKIAAVGLAPSSVPHHPSNQSAHPPKNAITSAPRDGAGRISVSPSSAPKPSEPQAQPKKVVQIATRASREPGTNGAAGPEVYVHAVDGGGAAHQSLDHTAASRLLAPAASEDANTQVSSGSDSAKVPSLDDKSVASGTTFALDEKESLRPDDSASAKATEDEDISSALDSGLPGSREGSEDGVRAFRDQLREISSMEPARRGITPQSCNPPGPPPPRGVLYVPPREPGVGPVSGPVRPPHTMARDVDFPPDPKILEALDNPRDRVWVLKLEQDVSDFLKDPKEASLDLPQCSSYQRMLAHKIADYCMLGHVVDESTTGVRIFKTPYCRLPPPLTGVTTPSTAASTPPPSAPQMKILRRGVDSSPAIANGSGIPSKTASENGENGNDDNKKSKPVSYEERVANYEAARIRIMGSAKPTESPEEPKDKQGSRSSSAAGKKSKKKQRSDSDDGFDTRSAYNAYYTPPYSSNGFSQPSYGFPPFNEACRQGNAPPANFNAQQASTPFQTCAGQGQSGMQWGSPGFAPGNGAQQWPQGQQPDYDLSGDFQRVMSFQTPSGSTPPANMPNGYNGTYPQQFYGSMQGWPQQPQYQAPPPYPNANGNGGFTNYQSRPSSSAGQFQDTQPYQYGQLPSQAFPGRPASKLEHPIPGSYKGKHFNPQSQAFVPGQQGNNVSFRPFPPQTAAASNSGLGNGYGTPNPNPWSRPAPSQPQSAAFGNPQTPPHAPSQPMIHPLPQPVFSQQPSPNMPLPAKPVPIPQKPAGPPVGPNSAGAASATSQSPSSISKWGAPASLPAKPPPSAEPFDPAKFHHIPRQPPYTAAAAARAPSGGMPSFGSMPPVGGSVNGGAGGAGGAGGQSHP